MGNSSSTKMGPLMRPRMLPGWEDFGLPATEPGLKSGMASSLCVQSRIKRKKRGSAGEDCGREYVERVTK